MKTIKLIGLAILLLFKIGYAADTLKVATHPIQYSKLIQKVAGIRKLRPIERCSEGGVKVKLGKIWVAGDSLFFKLAVSNRSNINYDIDFIRFYLRDLKTAKRTVTQEQELYPIECFNLGQKSIDTKSTIQYVFAIKKFAIAKGKALFIEIYEKNGSRHLYLKVKQKAVLKAKSISSLYK